VGSGAGIQRFIDNAVDFGASDVPMNNIEQTLSSVSGSPVVQIPIALGGVAIAYNEPKIRAGASLQLDGSTLANIFLNKITKWNDPAIEALNPGLQLPDAAIRPVHRSDSSGTTYIFTDYLSTVSPAWKSEVGTGKSVAWPNGGYDGKGSPGVADWVQRHEGGIGYVELSYAIAAHIQYMRIKNSAGSFVAPTLGSVTAAASQFPQVSASRFSIVNAPGAESYPIAGYSWVLLRQHPTDQARAQALQKLFRWLVSSDGQSFATHLNYAPIPSVAQSQALAGLDTLVGANA
jgi:phosphate transport system substrate-binding protein